jgi:hypothetical protein
MSEARHDQFGQEPKIGLPSDEPPELVEGDELEGEEPFRPEGGHGPAEPEEPPEDEEEDDARDAEARPYVSRR